jgi:hypothetical protein
MAALCAAATCDDAALDLALLRIGILAPVELDEIRASLAQPGVTARAAVNGDGHCVVELCERGETIAEIQHDGRLTAPSITRLAS